MSNFFKKVFGNKKSPTDGTMSTINKLREMEEMLGKKQTHLEQQVQEQLIQAKRHGLKNKRAAIAALKRKKRFEGMLQQLDGTLTTIELQREALESAKNNVAVLQAMKSAADSLKVAQQHMDVDKVHDVLDEIAEQQEVAEEISTAISNPIYSTSGSGVDEAELEAELEALEQEELDKELLKVETRPGQEQDDDVYHGPDSDDERRSSSAGKGRKNEVDSDLEELAKWGALE